MGVLSGRLQLGELIQWKPGRVFDWLRKFRYARSVDCDVEPKTFRAIMANTSFVVRE